MSGPGASDLSSRLAALTTEARPSFASALALAQDLQGDRLSTQDQQLVACRALLRSLPPTLPPSAPARLVSLSASWLAPSSHAAATAGGTLQLQAEAAHLAVQATSRAKLGPQDGRRLLQCACAALARPPPQPASVAAQELSCACLDILSTLPQWHPLPSKPELAGAVAAAAAALERATAGGPGALASRDETPAATRLLCKLLRALQALLAEAKKDHGANAASMATSLQRLFSYGTQQRAGGSGGSTPRRGASLTGSAAPFAASSGSGVAGGPSTAPAAVAAAARPAAGGRYRTPHSRRGTTQDEAGGSGGPGGEGSAAALHTESSDSESSDAEGGGGGGGERHHASRVRSGALACLQLLAKADPKSLHGSWTALLPTADPVHSRRGGGGGAASVAHLLLHDRHSRVRHAAAATIAVLLEGPAQRAYLAVAEARELERPPVRGFITLSASLGQVLVALHQGLLHSAQHESDAAVAAGALRALGTLLLGAPYHRLPPQLLPLCVAALQARLARATPAGGPAALAPDQLPIASACLACLAAAFSCKAAAGALADQLAPVAGGSGGGQQLLPLLFAYAASQQPALQLEATMALRGIAQQHAALLGGCWDQLLALGRAGAALAPPAVPQSPRAQAGAADGTLPEKVAQQSVRLPADYLQAAGEPAAAAAAGAGPAAAAVAEQWQQAAEQVVLPASQHSSPLLRAAAQAVIAAASPAAYAALPLPLQQQLLAWCFMAAVADEASPVRAAAAKAVGAVAACPAVCSVPGGVARVLEALTSGCRDPVLAVAAPATASLAAFCGMLGTAAAAAGPATAAAKEALPACLQLAVAAAEGSDKVRPSGLQALGGLFELASRLADQVGRQTAEELAAAASTEQQQLTAAVAAIQSCLASSNARVQWAACEAAGALLASHAPAVQQRAPAVLHDLLRLLQRCPNFRSRALAAAALRRLVALPAVASGGGAEPLGAVRLLDAVAGVLFEGKSSGFSLASPPEVPAAAAAAGAAGAAGGGGAAPPSDRLPPRPSSPPTGQGSRAALEAVLVAAVLHLLALLPSALEAAGTAAASPSSRAPQLRRLVQQAQQELAPLAAEGAAAAEEGMAAAAEDAGATFFDLSQATPAAVAAAARGLAVLR